MPTPLSPDDIRDLTERLERRYEEATQRATRLFDEALRAMVPVSSDLAAEVADPTPQPAEVHELAQLAHLAAFDAREADEALVRVASGTYGTCTDCGGPITLTRLRDRPDARVCDACQLGVEPGPSEHGRETRMRSHLAR